jgi:hypothetical protein
MARANRDTPRQEGSRHLPTSALLVKARGKEVDQVELVLVVGRTTFTNTP